MEKPRLSRRRFLLGSGAVLGVAAGPRAARAQARRGHVIAGLSERMLTLDPANHYSISSTSVLRHVYDPLLDVTNDDKFVPALAESWKPVNNTTWRFTLRKGVRFHDGTPFTADSVLFTLKRVRDNTKLIKSFVYQDLEDVRKDDDYTVTVTTKRPFGSLPAHLTMLGIKVLDTPAVEAQRWHFQLAREAGKDPRIRKAVSLAIDRNTIIKELLLGYARPVVSPIPPGLIGHTNLGQKPYDPDKARAILKQAGYQTLTLDFVLMKDLYPKQLEIPQAVAAMLSEVGIKGNIRSLEIATAREQRTAGNYDLFFSGWAHMPHDPDWYFGQWFTRAGAEKLTRFSDPRVEQLIAEGRVPDPKVRQQKYEEIEKILWEEEPEIWPYYSVAIYAISDKLRNFEARRDYYVLLHEVGIA